MNERNLDRIEEWVRKGMDLSDGNFVGANLSGRCISGGKFANSDFTGATMTETTMQRTDFTGCNMTRVDLADSDVESAIFTNCIGLFDAGIDPRGYRFLGIDHEDNGWRVKAGCRWYTLYQARDHWGPEGRGNEDAMARVKLIEAAANKSRQPDLID